MSQPVTLAEAMARRYPMALEWSEGSWFVSWPDLSGLLTDGETVPLALERAEEAREIYLSAALEAGVPIPEPGSTALAQLLALDPSPGAETLQRLRPGIRAVLDRLEYGATKHPGEPWKAQSLEEQLGALVGHVEALKAAYGDRIFDQLLDGIARQGHDVVVRPPCDKGAIRKHLAAIACRALMALTVDEFGKVAQSVERGPEKAEVSGSNPDLPTTSVTSNEVEKQAHPGKEPA